MKKIITAFLLFGSVANGFASEMHVDHATVGTSVVLPAGTTTVHEPKNAVHFTVSTEQKSEESKTFKYTVYVAGKMLKTGTSQIDSEHSSVDVDASDGCTFIEGSSDLNIVMDDSEGEENVHCTVLYKPTPLPVELVSFDGRYMNGHATLSWVTAQEQSFDHFVIERSDDGVVFYSDDNVRAEGTGSKYKLSVTMTRSTYFRLKMVDSDQKFTFSNVIYISVKPLIKNTQYFDMSGRLLSSDQIPRGVTIVVETDEQGVRKYSKVFYE